MQAKVWLGETDYEYSIYFRAMHVEYNSISVSVRGRTWRKALRGGWPSRM